MSTAAPSPDGTDLVAALAAMRVRLEAGGTIDLSPLTGEIEAAASALAERARLGPGDAQPTLAALLDELARISRSLVDARQGLRAELIELGSARRARHAYRGGAPSTRG